MSIRKKTIILAVLFTVIMSLFGQVFLYAFAVRASAAESVGIDDTSIEDDLSYVTDYDYPKNSFGEHTIIALMEYCYSEAQDYSSVYNLYVYVYNPTEKPVLIGPEVNSISVYFDDDKATTSPARYLKFLDRTDNHRFYKFKLYDSSEVLTKVKQYAASNDGKRSYKIGGLEIQHQGNDNAIDYAVAKTFTFTGYAALCDENKSLNETLTCTTTGNDVIPLTLKDTYYRFEDTSGGAGYDIMPTLSSVYFSVPITYFQKWGKITNLQAQWYEYKTQPIFVTSDAGAYSGLWDMRNIRINEYGKEWEGWEYNPSVPGGRVEKWSDNTLSYWRVLWEERFLPVYQTSGLLGFGKTYNGKCRDDIDDSNTFTFGGYNGDPNSWIYEDNIFWLFYDENVTGVDAYVITSDEMKNYMRNFTYNFPGEDVRGYSSLLFADSIDENRKEFLKANEGLENENYVASSGLVVRDFAAEIEGEFKIPSEDQDEWDKFWNGIDIVPFKYDPIVFVSEGDLVLDTDTFSKKYRVNPNDVAEFKAFCKESFDKGEVPTLLRFAVTEYYASKARFDYAEEDKFDMSDYDGYVAQETVFLDFDVLSLTFKDEGSNRNIIPVVASPIDIIHDLTPPEGLVEDEPWWQVIVALLGLILLIVAIIFLWPIISPVLSVVISLIVTAIKFLFKILTLPFRLLGRLLFGKGR